MARYNVSSSLTDRIELKRVAEDIGRETAQAVLADRGTTDGYVTMSDELSKLIDYHWSLWIDPTVSGPTDEIFDDVDVARTWFTAGFRDGYMEGVEDYFA